MSDKQVHQRVTAGEACSCHEHEPASCAYHEDEKNGCGCHEDEKNTCSCHEHDGCGRCDDDDDDCGCGCCDDDDDDGCGCGCDHDHDEGMSTRETTLMVASAVLIGGGLLAEYAMQQHLIAALIYAAAAVCGLIFIGPSIPRALKRRKATINVLMGVAVVGALIMGIIESTSGTLAVDVFRDAAVVIFLNQIGEWLEGWSKRKTTGSIEELMELAPDQAWVIASDGTAALTPSKDVRLGSLVRVKAGERVPLDGVIEAGTSALNEAPISGEPLLAQKGVGATVFGGSLNVSGVLEVRVTSTQDAGTIARIIKMVHEANRSKAPYEAFINRFAALYTPAIMAMAACVGLGVPLILSVISAASGAGMPNWQEWIWRALTLLVIACPCALVISTPVSFVSAITRAARMGVLVKGGAYLDIASKINAVAFDKTGTLTEGKPRVTGIYALPGTTQEDILAVAAALEANSAHPLAEAVLAAAQEQELMAPTAHDVTETAGLGLQGVLGSGSAAHHVILGSPSYVSQHAAIPDGLTAEIARAESTGHTCLVLAADGRVQGALFVADQLRATTPAAIQALGHEGVSTTVMLTGDSQGAAAAIASQAHITSVEAKLLPDQKVAAIQRLKARGLRVAMVGDGINDAPALAAADLGITMGKDASDTALEVANVALLSGTLQLLPAFFALAKRCMWVVKENIAIAIGVKVAVMVLAILGYAGMGAAIFADTGVALLVILNGMRLMTKLNTRF